MFPGSKDRNALARLTATSLTITAVMPHPGGEKKNEIYVYMPRHVAQAEFDA